MLLRKNWHQIISLVITAYLCVRSQSTIAKPLGGTVWNSLITGTRKVNRYSSKKPTHRTSSHPSSLMKPETLQLPATCSFDNLIKASLNVSKR